MPCRDYDYDDRQVSKFQYDNCKARLDHVTQMLCALLGRLEKEGFAQSYVSQVKGLSGWWEEHKEQDRQRLAVEAAERERKRLRRAGLKKLTKEEREALDL